MPIVFWDASGLTKRYYVEVGSSSVDAVFNAAATCQMVTTYWGYAETHASLLRKRNRREMSGPAFRTALTLLRGEIGYNPDWQLLTIEDTSVLAGIDLLLRHNLNSADGAVLATYLRYVRAQPPGAPPSVLIAADTRLVRAASAEGLSVLNPEAVAAADVPAFLAAL